MPAEVPLWRLVAINGAAFGHEISACVAYTYVPPLLLKAGFSETAMTVVMGIAPFLALFTIPLIGRWSDGCQSSLGRRRPFILAISLFLVCSLLVIPYADAICRALRAPLNGLVHASLLASGVVMMDYASLVAFNPCEALVCDLLQEDNANGGASSQESARRFAIYSAMISLGSCLGYLVTAVHWQTLGLRLGNQEQTAFLVVIFLLSLGVGGTMCLAQEAPPVNVAVQRPLFKRCRLGLNVDLKRGAAVVCKAGRILRTILTLPLRLWEEFLRVPTLLRQLFVSTLVAWLAVNCQGLFFTDYVGQAVYKGSPNTGAPLEQSALYDLGVRRGCLGLFLHGVLACLYSALAQDRITNWVGLRGTYFLGMAVYSVSMVAILLSSQADWVTFWALVSGTGFAVVTTIPPCLVALYNGNQSLFYAADERPPAAAEERGFGGDIAVLECAFCLSRILLATLMGAAVESTGLVHCYMIGAALFGLLACFLSWRLVYHLPASPCCTSIQKKVAETDTKHLHHLI